MSTGPGGDIAGRRQLHAKRAPLRAPATIGSMRSPARTWSTETTTRSAGGTPSEAARTSWAAAPAVDALLAGPALDLCSGGPGSRPRSGDCEGKRRGPLMRPNAHRRPRRQRSRRLPGGAPGAGRRQPGRRGLQAPPAGARKDRRRSRSAALPAFVAAPRPRLEPWASQARGQAATPGLRAAGRTLNVRDRERAHFLQHYLAKKRVRHRARIARDEQAVLRLSPERRGLSGQADPRRDQRRDRPPRLLVADRPDHVQARCPAGREDRGDQAEERGPRCRPYAIVASGGRYSTPGMPEESPCSSA